MHLIDSLARLSDDADDDDDAIAVDHPGRQHDELRAAA